LVFKIDGAMTCTIAKSYVPSAPMYVKVSMFAGNAGGPVSNGTFPWITMIDYVKISQGSNVVFNEDFNLASTVQPGPAATNNALPASHLIHLEVPKTRLRWSLLALIACLILVGAATALRRKRV
jgi:hypothetical protein